MKNILLLSIVVASFYANIAFSHPAGIHLHAHSLIALFAIFSVIIAAAFVALVKKLMSHNTVEQR